MIEIITIALILTYVILLIWCLWLIDTESENG